MREPFDYTGFRITTGELSGFLTDQFDRHFADVFALAVKAELDDEFCGALVEIGHGPEASVISPGGVSLPAVAWEVDHLVQRVYRGAWRDCLALEPGAPPG